MANRPSPPPAPANFTAAQYAEYAETLSLEELVLAAKAFGRELKAREGKLKFQPTLPDHIKRMVN